MRELKFRAWDTLAKKMRDHNLDPQVIQAVIFGNHYDGRVAIMQFTGLKDKNGKEIYEGDIFPYGKKNLIVRYECGGWTGNWLGLNLFIFINEFPNVENCLEIIGNIYESPELLELEVI